MAYCGGWRREASSKAVLHCTARVSWRMSFETFEEISVFRADAPLLYSETDFHSNEYKHWYAVNSKLRVLYPGGKYCTYVAYCNVYRQIEI
jgi:hypothetical protein